MSSTSGPAADTETPAERATRVARVRSEIDAGIWVVIWLSLAFTAINVQIFAARGAETYSLAWWAAWLLDPMVSILVLVVVRAEQITSRWQVTLGWPITATKWGCFAATYAMNTWSSWVERSPSMIVLHSVPPAMMLLAAEVGPRIRDGLTRAVQAASAQYGRQYSGQYAAAEQAPGEPASGHRPAPHAPLPQGGAQDRAPDGARGLDPAVSSAGSGSGRVPDPETVEVESPTTDTTTGSAPDRTRQGPDPAENHPERTPDHDGADSAPGHEPSGDSTGSPAPADTADSAERNERVWRLAQAMLGDARTRGVAGRAGDGGIVEDDWSGSRAATVLGGSRRNGQRLVARAATLARALQDTNPPTPPNGIDLAVDQAVEPGGQRDDQERDDHERDEALEAATDTDTDRSAEPEPEPPATSPGPGRGSAPAPTSGTTPPRSGGPDLHVVGSTR